MSTPGAYNVSPETRKQRGLELIRALGSILAEFESGVDELILVGASPQIIGAAQAAKSIFPDAILDASKPPAERGDSADRLGHALSHFIVLARHELGHAMDDVDELGSMSERLISGPLPPDGELDE